MTEILVDMGCGLEVRFDMALPEDVYEATMKVLHTWDCIAGTRFGQTVHTVEVTDGVCYIFADNPVVGKPSAYFVFNLGVET